MSAITWTQTVEELSPAALTVRAQAISPNDDGMLKWDMFFPRRDVESVDLKDVTTLNYRPVADRREWNQKGRLIPVKTPNIRDISIVPIESYYTYGEHEMQKLNERTMGNDAIIQQIMGTQIPARVMELAKANYRRLEVDAFTAWATGAVVQRNPQNASQTFSASFGFDAARYTTAITAWNDAGQNAYNNLLAWLDDATNAIGPLRGVMCRRNFVNEVIKDAPTLVGGVTMTRAQIESRIMDDLGQPFKFYVNDDTVDVFDDGGTATTTTKVWTAQRVAAIPAGTMVGNAAFAPVIRAMELASQVPGAGIDTNGMVVYYLESNGGRELTVEAQMNALPVPDEQKMFVINVGF